MEFSIIVYSLPMDVLHDDSLVFVRYSEEVNSSETLASSFHNRAISFLCFIFSINILLSEFRRRSSSSMLTSLVTAVFLSGALF